MLLSCGAQGMHTQPLPQQLSLLTRLGQLTATCFPHAPLKLPITSLLPLLATVGAVPAAAAAAAGAATLACSRVPLMDPSLLMPRVADKPVAAQLTLSSPA